MFWIALLPSHEDERTAWGWRALAFTPRVAAVEEALLLEASASVRMFGGREALLDQLFRHQVPLAPAAWMCGPTALVALALLRLYRRGLTVPAPLPGALPIDTLSAAAEHEAALARIGCRTWADLRALPRGGVARRFGAGLLDALDAAWGERPERYRWLALPEVFDVNLELPELATTAPELMWTAQRLLAQLMTWLQARHHGVLAFELEWTLDLKRLDGKRLPSHQQLVVRTAEPSQDGTHLRRLVGEQLARTPLAAPVNRLRLRTLATEPRPEASRSFLPEDHPQGEKLHQLVERLSARLGEQNVVVPVPQADHRPERMQRWIPAKDAKNGRVPSLATSAATPAITSPISSAMSSADQDALYPPWLLPQPLRLVLQNNQPQYEGPLRLLTRMQRVETGWWEAGGAVVRDYCVAASDKAGLLWIYREQQVLQPGGAAVRDVRWFLQGLYA